LNEEQIAKVFRNIRLTFRRYWRNAWRRHRIARCNYFLARRANWSLEKLLLHLYLPFSCASARATGTRPPYHKCHGISNITREIEIFTFFLVKTLVISRGHFLTALSTTLIFATSLGDEHTTAINKAAKRRAVYLEFRKRD